MERRGKMFCSGGMSSPVSSSEQNRAEGVLALMATPVATPVVPARDVAMVV